MQPSDRRPGVAEVDQLVDEFGSPVDVPDGSKLEMTAERPSVGATSPTNWWRLGLVGLGIVALILLVLQLLSGGGPGTEVVPGTPVAAPQLETVE